jgi:hypothetical protein
MNDSITVDKGRNTITVLGDIAYEPFSTSIKFGEKNIKFTFNELKALRLLLSERITFLAIKGAK